jgi:hypothetical protein
MFHSYQGVQVPIQAQTLSPQHCRPGLSMVLRPSQPNIYITTIESRPEKSRNLWQESNKSSHSHKQVYARENKSVTWPGSMQRTVLNWHRRNKCNKSPALLPNRVQVHPPIPPGLQLSIYIYIPCDSNMIIVTIRYSYFSRVTDNHSASIRIL